MRGPSDNLLEIEYVFLFKKDTSIQKYKIAIDKEQKKIISYSWEPDEHVSWSNLGFYKCVCCTLDESLHPKCPIALNLQSLIEVFADHQSIEEIELQIHVPHRTYKKETTLQYGLQALFGLLMASSGCPHMKFLAPMALFHMPFSDTEETLLRSAFFYLMNQFFKKLDGKSFDFSMEGLKKHYADVERVNEGIIARIRGIEHLGEANENALVILNTFAQMFSFQYAYDLKMLKYIFQD